MVHGVTPSGIIGNPVSYVHDGKQYVAVLTGVGGWAAIKEKLTMLLADARRVIVAAEKKAAEIHQPMNIAEAWIGSVDISIKKAYTSRAFDIATKDLATHSQSGGQFFGIHASNNGKIMIFAGGIPLKRNGKVVGAIGVSGGSGEQDHAVAEAGAAAFEENRQNR